MIIIGIAVWIILIIWIAIEAVPGLTTAVLTITAIVVTLYLLLRYIAISIRNLIKRK